MKSCASLSVALVAATFALAAAPGGLVAQTIASHPVPAPSAAERLKRLFADADEGNLKRNPINGILRGDMRYADQFGDYISEAYYNAERAAITAALKALGAIDRNALNATDRIAYDVFEQQNLSTLKSFSPGILALTASRPMDHFTGFHTFYPNFASGQGAAPFRSVEDYENNLKRHQGFALYLDRAIGRFRQGIRSGVVQPKLTVRNMIDQLDRIIAEGVDGSTFYGPVAKFPEGVSAQDQSRLKAEHVASIRDVLIPAHTRLRNFLKTHYLPAAREGAGLSYMKGGAMLYRYQIEQNTTLPLTADYVHNLGLSEVARIRMEMEAIKIRVGFKGTLAQFFVHIRNDPKFKLKTKEDLVNGYYLIGKRVDARIGEIFSTTPKSPLEIRYYEPYREKNEAGGSYQPGVYDPKQPANNRPGIFYFNTYDLPSRTTPGMETLYLHEGAPGHHFQVSLAQENEALPAFMRFGGNTAYVEGWALYAETLYDELGMETDPYSRFGGLDDEMLRAMRLVVDSGIHAKGWSREQAIKYMLSNSAMGETDATAEVERYIAMPGQALAYKIGQLTILRLRAKAEAAMGQRFSLTDFHAQVLMTGGLPMSVLEKKIDDWIGASK
jgi:uncharacterized protein (DUF885 family)